MDKTCLAERYRDCALFSTTRARTHYRTTAILDAAKQQETNRLATPSGPELFLNFGATVDAAKTNTSPRIVIVQNAAPTTDAVSHVIFTVTDAVATVAAVKAAGGSVDREPTPFANSGIVIALVVDPAGNHIELLQPAQH